MTESIRRAERFGPRLREIREAANLTQQQLADAAGLKRLSVVRYESGDRYPTWDVCLALADALGVAVQAFAAAPEKSADSA